MKPYGVIKTKGGNHRNHRNCSICDPDDPNKGTARQRVKNDTKEAIRLADHFELTETSDSRGVTKAVKNRKRSELDPDC